MTEPKTPGPIATRIAQGIIDFEAKHGHRPKEIGLGFNTNVMLAHELGLPLDANIVDFLGIPATQPIDLRADGVAFR